MKPGTAEYRTLHYWVERQLGKPMQCSNCGSKDRERYHWANISGEYKKDIKDWRRLCIPCHTSESYRYGPGKCKNGHEITEENTYVRPEGYTHCRTCRKESHKRSNLISNARRSAERKYLKLKRK